MSLNDLFNSLPDVAETKPREDVEEGTYNATVVAARLEESRDGDPVVRWELVIKGGKHDKRHLWKNTFLKEKTAWVFVRDAEVMGVKEVIKNYDTDIPLALEGCLEKGVEVSVKYNEAKNGKTYQNIYFNRKLDGDVGRFSVDDEADVPFFK